MTWSLGIPEDKLGPEQKCHFTSSKSTGLEAKKPGFESLPLSALWFSGSYLTLPELQFPLL